MENWFGPFCAFLSSVTWAIGSSTYSKLSHQYTAFSVNFTRAILALPLFVIAVFIAEGGWGGGVQAYSLLGWRHLGWFTLSMIASYGLGDVLFLWSTRYLGVPGALAVASTYPLWTAVSGFVYKGEGIHWFQLLGLFITLGGMVLVILNAPKLVVAQSESNQAHARLRLKGVLFALATSGFWALNSLAVSQGGSDISPFVGNTVRMIMALVMSTTMARVFAAQGSMILPLGHIRSSVPIFMFEAFCGSLVFVYGLAHSPLVIGSTLASLAPVLAVPVAWFLRLEKFSAFRTTGVILVVIGLTLLVSGISS